MTTMPEAFAGMDADSASTNMSDGCGAAVLTLVNRGLSGGAPKSNPSALRVALPVARPRFPENFFLGQSVVDDTNDLEVAA